MVEFVQNPYIESRPVRKKTPNPLIIKGFFIFRTTFSKTIMIVGSLFCYMHFFSGSALIQSPSVN